MEAVKEECDSDFPRPGSESLAVILSNTFECQAEHVQRILNRNISSGILKYTFLYLYIIFDFSDRVLLERQCKFYAFGLKLPAILLPKISNILVICRVACCSVLYVHHIKADWSLLLFSCRHWQPCCLTFMTDIKKNSFVKTGQHLYDELSEKLKKILGQDIIKWRLPYVCHINGVHYLEVNIYFSHLV